MCLTGTQNFTLVLVRGGGVGEGREGGKGMQVRLGISHHSYLLRKFKPLFVAICRFLPRFVIQFTTYLIFFLNFSWLFAPTHRDTWPNKKIDAAAKMLWRGNRAPVHCPIGQLWHGNFSLVVLFKIGPTIYFRPIFLLIKLIYQPHLIHSLNYFHTWQGQILYGTQPLLKWTGSYNLQI